MTMTNQHLKGLYQSGSSAQEDCKFNIKGQKYLSTNQDPITKQHWILLLLPGGALIQECILFLLLLLLLLSFCFVLKKSWDHLFVSWQEKRIRLDLFLFQQYPQLPYPIVSMCIICQSPTLLPGQSCIPLVLSLYYLVSFLIWFWNLKGKKRP